MKRITLKRETIRRLTGFALRDAKGGVIQDTDSALCGGGGGGGTRMCTWEVRCIPDYTNSCATCGANSCETCQANSNCGCTFD